jgi:type I restriction enzyme, S subunit
VIGSDWRTVKLGEICSFKYGQMPKRSELADEGFPVFSGYRVVGRSPKYHYRDPEIIVVARGVGGTGDVKMSPPFCFLTNLSIATLVESPDVHKPFLFYRLAGTKLWDLRTGSAQAQITIERLREYEVRVPSLPIQLRIAGILSAYDELIENNQRRIKILEEMARSLYREWFVHFRFPGHDKVKIVTSPLGPIPQAWEVKTVEEVVKRIPVGRKYDQKTVSATGTVPVLDQGKSGIIGYHDDEPGVVASETAPVVVFANHTCHQSLIHFPFSTIQNVLPFVPNPAIPRNIYWLHWTTNGLVAFNDYKGHWPEFAAKTLVIPPADVCACFGDFAAPLARQALNLERAIENLRRTRDLLLPRLLSGQIDLANGDV